MQSLRFLEERRVATGDWYRDIESPRPKHFKPAFSWADPLLSLCAFQCHTAGCGYRTRCPLPTDACSCSWQRCVCCRGWQDTHCPGADTTAPATRRESWSLLVHCLLCFSAVAGRRPWLFPPALAGPFGYSARLSVASMATPWLRSCFPTGMLSPQTVSRLAPVPSPMTITLAGSAVRGRAATAHHPLLFSLDNQFPGCWLQAVVAFLQHPAPQGLATWA